MKRQTALSLVLIFVTVVGFTAPAVATGASTEAQPADSSVETTAVDSSLSGLASLSTAADPGTISPGENVTISYNLTNTNDSARAYILDLNIPDGFTLIGQSTDGGTYQSTGTSILWQTISPGQSVTPSITLQASGSASGALDVFAEVQVSNPSQGIAAEETTPVTVEGAQQFQTFLDGREDPDGVKEVDLSQFLGSNAIQLKFADYDTSNGLGPQLVNFELRADGETITAIGPGVGVDDQYIVNESESNPTQGYNIRFADANAFFTYEFAVPENADNLTATIDVNNEFLVSARSSSIPEFEVSNLSAPANATQGDTIAVNATVTNVGEAEGTTDAQYVFDGNTLFDRTVTLGVGESTDVSFQVPIGSTPTSVDPVGRWSFGSGNVSGDTVIDGSGNGNNGTILGGVTPGVATPAPGDGATFNGVNGTVVVPGDGDQFDSGAYTISMWAQTEDAGFYAAYMGKNGSFWAGNGPDGSNPRLDAYDGREDIGAILSDTSIDDGEWHHLTFRHAPSENESAIYVDGDLAAVSDEAVPSPASDDDLAIGSKSNQSDFISADLADVRFYNESIPESDVTALFAEGIPAGTYEHGVRAGDSFATADLTVEPQTSFEVSNLSAPANATAGETVTVNATVTNVGGVEDSVNAEFVFGGNALLTETVALESGESADVSFQVPTAGVAPGTYQHGVRAADSIQSASITLGVAEEFQTILDGREDPNGVKEVDLSQFIGGDAVQLKFEDWDTSDGLGAQLVNLDIRADGESIATIEPGVDVDEQYLVDERDSNAGQSGNIRYADANAFFTYEFPVPEGTERLTATIDVNNEFLVSGQAASAAFEVSGLDAPANATQGDTIAVNATVTNTGEAEGTTDAEFVFGGNVLANRTVTLASGASTNVSFQVPTGDVAPGTYQHGVQVEGDNQTAQITIQQPATFEVSNLSAPANAVAGETITVNATVTNMGQAEGTIDAEFVFGGNVLANRTVTLAGGASTDVSFQVPTDDVAPGTYQHGVQVEGDNQTAQITIQQPATFAVSNLNAPANAVAGETITVNATVTNTGDAEGTTDAEFVFGGNVLANRTVTLASGASTDVSFQVPTGDVAPGTYQHGVQVEGDNQTAQITIQQPATFAVSNLSAPANAVVGETITVNATVTNVGDVQGTTDAEFVFGGNVPANRTVTLASGAATDVSFQVPTGDVAPGTYQHGVQVEGDNQTAQITIQQPATFELSNLQAPDNATVNETIEVSGTLSNVGDVSGTVTAEVTFNGSVVRTQQVTLGAGDSVSVSANVSTSGLAAGNYTYTITAGDANESSQVSIDADSGEDSDTIAPGQPGFGLVIALFALIAAALIAHRRD